MTASKNITNTQEQDNSPPLHHVRLPGFISDEDIGLGDVIKRTTSYFGIKPCGGFEQRAMALNRWMIFTNDIWGA